MSDDPFSAILSLVEARAACGGGFTAGGPWSMRFPAPTQLKFFVVARGECWLALDGEAEPYHLRQGDVFLLGTPRSFVAASDLSLPSRHVHEVLDPGFSGIKSLDGGDALLFIGGHVDLASGSGRLLLDSLPPAIHLPGDCAEAARLGWLIQQLAEEYERTHAGADFACAALAQMIFLQLLRAHLAREADIGPGWLRAMVDPRLGPALRLMHGDPGRAWHLPELARATAMSRTAFATRFKAVTGIGPLAYLAEWRMRLAERWLADGTRSIAQIARETGFGSDAAFSNAFKRIRGVASSHFRARIRGGAEDAAFGEPMAAAAE
jgi:AraC-like DNA-binding protein